jgi:hypothetical protein
MVRSQWVYKKSGGKTESRERGKKVSSCFSCFTGTANKSECGKKVFAEATKPQNSILNLRWFMDYDQRHIFLLTTFSTKSENIENLAWGWKILPKILVLDGKKLSTLT